MNAIINFFQKHFNHLFALQVYLNIYSFQLLIKHFHILING